MERIRGKSLGKKKIISEEEIENGVARRKRRPRHSGNNAGFRPNLGELAGRPRTPLQNLRQVKKKGLDKAGRHRSGLSMGLPVRQARRHHMAIQEKSSRMTKKEWIPKNLVERI